ncbi:MAG: hypothetical protein Q8942_04575 [Bacillota bacterium]|nr:hypothetical protein [Bacillota bacterium]
MSSFKIPPYNNSYEFIPLSDYLVALKQIPNKTIFEECKSLDLSFFMLQFHGSADKIPTWSNRTIRVIDQNGIMSKGTPCSNFTGNMKALNFDLISMNFDKSRSKSGFTSFYGDKNISIFVEGTIQ